MCVLIPGETLHGAVSLQEPNVMTLKIKETPTNTRRHLEKRRTSDRVKDHGTSPSLMVLLLDLISMMSARLYHCQHHQESAIWRCHQLPSTHEEGP